MLQDINLRELAEMTGNGRDFVSLYFSVTEGLDSLKGCLRNVRNLLDDDLDVAQHFDLTIERMRRLVEENRRVP